MNSETNGGIPDEFKGRVCEFVDAAAAKYPDVDLRVLEHNLAGIEIADCEEGEVQETCSESTAGYYSESDNRVCISSPNGYAKGTWDYQLLPHELCHAMRRARFEYEGNDVHIHPIAWDVEVVDEAFTSIVVGSLIGWPDGELAYQPEVNMVRVMLECVDGYELEDYYRQSLQRFAAKLDEACGDRNYAMTMFKLMQAQHDFIHFCSMSVSAMLIEVVVRLGYAIKRAKEGVAVKNAIPVSTNHEKMPKLETMLFTAHSAAAAINAGKVAFTENPMAINYPQWIAFAKYSYQQLKWGLVTKPALRDRFVLDTIGSELQGVYEDIDRLFEELADGCILMLPASANSL